MQDDETCMAPLSGCSGVRSTARDEPCHCRSWRAWPPDALTSLVMQADSVPERVLDALLQRIIAARAAPS